VVDIPAIGKKARFSVVNQDNLRKNASVGKCTALSLFASCPVGAQVCATDVWGNLMFKEISKLANSYYADYNDDRILFYSKSGSTGSPDFVAVVGPLPWPPFVYCTLNWHGLVLRFSSFVSFYSFLLDGSSSLPGF
jgi:hypothetical protein